MTLENDFIGVVLNFPLILNACSILCFMQFSAITLDPHKNRQIVWYGVGMSEEVALWSALVNPWCKSLRLRTISQYTDADFFYLLLCLCLEAICVMYIGCLVNCMTVPYCICGLLWSVV